MQKKARTSTGIVLFVLTLTLGFVQGSEIPTPEAVIGFRVGSDRQLADWQHTCEYFRRLAAASDRVLVKEAGKSTQGNPFLVVTISSPANLAGLEQIRRNNLRLADARGLAKNESEALVANGKTIVALLYGVHPLEFAGSLSALETAFMLAKNQDAETAAILDQTVIIMVPSVNPDGMQRAVAWYRNSLGKSWENGPFPFLQHPYTGEELNHDWFMFSQVETRLVAENVYDCWRPQIVQDLHQMNQYNGRIFLPPYRDPWDPDIDPAIISAVNALGSHMAAALIAEGKQGVVTNAIYNPWQVGRFYPHTHGGVRILTESALSLYASAIEVSFAEYQMYPGLGYDVKKASWNYPAPWPGGTWRLRDAIDYQVSSTRALLDHAVKNRTYWLRTFHDVLARAASRTKPFAFVVPAGGRDTYAVSRMLEILHKGGVEIHRAKATFAIAGRHFSAGSHVVLMAQPFSTHAKILFERQHWPASIPPLGDSAHTLPLLMGVEVVAVPEPFPADLERVPRPGILPGSIERTGRWYVLGHGTGEMKALGLLLKASVPVRWAKEAFQEDERTYPAGSLIVPASALPRLEALCHDLGISAFGIQKAPAAYSIRKPRVALYQSWQSSVDEGWTRFVFEREMAVDYVTVHNTDLRAENLHSRFDAILFPDESADTIVSGFSHRPYVPEEYIGGIGEKGVDNLKKFVAHGGTLVAINEATAMPIKHFPLTVVNDLKKPAAENQIEQEEKFNCPGAILQAGVSRRHILAQGLDDTVSLWFSPRSPAFAAPEGITIASYGDQPLLSGWLDGGKNLKNLAALVEVPFDKGRIILFGFRPLFKAESWATYVLLLNSVYTSAINLKE